MKTFLPLVASVLLAFPALADSFSSGGLTFVTTSDTTVELSAADVNEGEVVIPETVTDASGKTYTVTSIGAKVFYDKRQITSVSMPNTILSIGNEAFKFCMGMTKAQLSENLETIGANAFQTTRALTEINWPATLKSIKAYAFQYSTGYSGQIRLPKGISLDDYAFINMSKATSLWLDGQPSEWGVDQCMGCNELTEFYVNCLYPPLFDPSQTFSVDEDGWDDPVEITLYVPVGAKENYLADKKWSARFQDIQEYEFTGTDTSNPGGDTPGPDERVYETYTDTWSEDYTSARLNVPEAGKLNELLGEHTETLKELALSGELNGDDILWLRQMAGTDIDGTPIDGAKLETLDLTNCEIVPGGGPYYSYLQTHYTEQDIVGPKMFSYCYSLKSFSMPKYAQAIGANAFEKNNDLSVFNCNATVKSIGELAFYDCLSLESVELPDCCSAFADMVFYTCASLKSVHLPASLTSLPMGTFYFCTSLPEITLPSGIKNIENLAFHNCASLQTVHIPAATYKIASTAFGLCSSLIDISVDADNMDFSDIDGVLFNKNKSQLILYPGARLLERYEVPEGTVIIGENAMQNALFKELVMPEGVTTMMPGSAYGCKQLERVEMPATLTVIDKAFDGCTALRDYVVADGNTKFADIEGVLCDSSKATLLKYPLGRTEESYIVPAPVTEIGEEAFSHSPLKSVTLSEGVTTVGVNAFALCSDLESASLPASLTLLREGSFGATALTEVHCAATVPPTCEYTEYEDGISHPFAGVDVAQCKLYVPEEALQAYLEADVWRNFNIQGVTGIEAVTEDINLEGASFYTMDGRRATDDAKGLIIVRTADGRVYKSIRR